MKRLLERPGIIFSLIICWKLVLLLAVAQPVPSNDAFFYDGPVVHLLNHGGYFNPSIAQSRPFSGTQFFCAYPPLYQLAMLLWMTMFGTSVLAAMACHLAMFGGCALVMLDIFRRLKVPALTTSLAGLFLLGITFDDRPDGLACLLGTLGVHALVCWLTGTRGAAWFAACFACLTVCTSLQLGALYSSWIFLGLLLGGGKSRPPLGPLGLLILAPLALVAAVKFGWPQGWAGFQENVHGNASLTGWRLPQLGDCFKAVRNLPAVLTLGVLVAGTPSGRRFLSRIKTWNPGEIVFLTGLLTGLGFVFACLLVVAPNWLLAISYFQPLLAGCFLARFPEFLRQRRAALCLALLIALVSIRAVGLSTWGVACSLMDSQASARQRVAVELAAAPPHATILLSSAYLYEGDRHTNVDCIHEDYTPRREEGEDYPRALRRLRPAKLLLTQYDFYRRYQTVLAALSAAGGVQCTITNTAQLRPPDSYASLQRVLQHVSWAPVIVDLNWAPPPP